MKRNDLLLLGAVLLLTILLFAGYQLIPGKPGNLVVIKENDAIIKTFPIEKNTTYTIHSKNGGRNLLQIKNGSASVKDANCPDKLCVHQRKISKKGETLVCLPHKIVISIQSSSDTDPKDSFDGVVQ